MQQTRKSCPAEALLTIITVLALLPAVSQAAGHFALAFQRKLPAWENSADASCSPQGLGGRACRVWVWDEDGRPLNNIKLYTTWGVHMGTTDVDGRCEVNFSPDIGFDLICIDGYGASSDAGRIMTADLTPCHERHSWEVGFLYKSDITNPGFFDTSIYGEWPKQGDYTTQVPYTKSLAYNSVDHTDYWSDGSYWGNWQNPPSYFGQTFVATGDRVVSARVQGTIGGNDLLDWNIQIVEFPSLVPVGPAVSVPVRFPFGWQAYWGVDDNPVVPGNTYMLKIWRNGGMNIYHVVNDVYPHGMYYEGTTAVPEYDLNGHIVCMNYKDYFDPNGLLLYWNLDEPSGSGVFDSSGYSRHGLAYGTARLPNQGPFGSAMLFDGSNDSIISINFKGVPYSRDRTASAWIKTTMTQAGDILSWGSDGPGASWILFTSGAEASGALGIWVGQGFKTGKTNVCDGEWRHVAAVLETDDDPDVSDVILYVDGQKEQLDGLTAQRIRTIPDKNVRVGVFDDGLNHYFEGAIDEVAIFDVALSDKQMLRLKNLSGRSFTNPCGDPLFDENTKLDGDVNRDCKVNGFDFALLADFWLGDRPMPSGDFVEDGVIDNHDVAVLAANWLGWIDPNNAVNLVAHWKLDEKSGVIAKDSAGAHDGTIQGEPIFKPTGGKAKGAVAFDGVDDFVTTDFVIDPAAGPFTVCVWIRGALPGRSIIAQADGTGVGKAWLASSGVDGRLTTYLSDGGRLTPALMGLASITDGLWHHIAFVWDGSQRSLYVDGRQVVADVKDILNLQSADGGLFFATDKYQIPANRWSGMIDDIRIYNKALSQEEIAPIAQLSF